MGIPLNSIPNDQNTQSQLDRLAAQRYLYAKAKKILGFQLTLTVPIIVILSILVAVCPNLKIWAALYAIFVSILDAAVLDSIQKSIRQEAAKIQELFDCDVLHLEWPTWKIVNPPDAELIHEVISKYKHNDFSYDALLDWYPKAVGELPLHIARIVCQRSNLRFDMSLRRRYSTWIIIAFFIFGVSVSLIGVIGGMTMEKFLLTVMAPILPALLWGIREYKRQMAAVETLNHLKNYTESLWTNVTRSSLPAEQAETKSRHLQDGIFEHRRNSPLIFDWVYELLRSAHEEQMQKGAEELAEEALKRREQTI